MFSQINKPLYSSAVISRRASKQLVQMVIGIIGILGIMLAHVEVEPSHINTQVLNSSGNAVSNGVE